MARTMATSRGMKPWRSPWPCTERGSMTRQERTPRSAAASAARMLVMRAATGPAAMSSSRSVAGRPGVTMVAPEITRGLPEPARPAASASIARASVRVAASVTLGTTKARWITPSLSRAPARRTSVSVRSPRKTSAPMAATAVAEVSERASPGTWWPAPMSSGTTAEPAFQPDAVRRGPRSTSPLGCRGQSRWRELPSMISSQDGTEDRRPRAFFRPDRAACSVPLPFGVFGADAAGAAGASAGGC